MPRSLPTVSYTHLKAGGTGNLGIAGKAEIQIKSVHHSGQNQHGGAVIRIVGKNRIQDVYKRQAQNRAGMEVFS